MSFVAGSGNGAVATPNNGNLGYGFRFSKYCQSVGRVRAARTRGFEPRMLFPDTCSKMPVVLRGQPVTAASSDDARIEQKHRNDAFGQYTGNIPSGSSGRTSAL
jgi:hypothetical protein